MVSLKNANAMAEVIHYLKGIRQEDIDKIPKKFLEFLNENASKEYICNFDYNKPLKDLNLLDETRGIISMICYNYWCITENQKKQYLKRLIENEQKNQEFLNNIYNPDNLFKSEKAIEETTKNTEIVKYKTNLLKKIILKFKNFFIKSD